VAQISISHKHAQPESTVRAALDELMVQLKEDYQIVSVWQGSHINFHRSGASGTLTIHPHRLEVDIKLSMMLSMFEKKIRSAITDFCTEKLPS
jgi:putative polyhydroxyalkanoate system protein